MERADYYYPAKCRPEKGLTSTHAHTYTYRHTHIFKLGYWINALHKWFAIVAVEVGFRVGVGDVGSSSINRTFSAHTHTYTDTRTYKHIYIHAQTLTYTHRAIQIKTGKTTRKINFCFSKPMPPFPLSLARLPSDIGKLIYWSIIFYLLFECWAGGGEVVCVGVWLLLEAYAFDSCFWIWRPFIVFLVVVASVILLLFVARERERDSNSVNWSCESEADKHHKVIKWKTIICLLTGSIQNLTNFVLILLKYIGNIVK